MPQPTDSSQEYWISGYGLSRHIVLRQMQYFLGPAATVRPYSYHGREGFLIQGPKLTKEQIEDLRRQSREYERQQTMRMSNKVLGVTPEDECDINEIVNINASRRHNPAYSASSHAPYKRYR